MQNLKLTPREKLVLFAINTRRMYPLDIVKRIKDKTEEEMSLGAIYPILQCLEEKGFITREWGDQTSNDARRRYARCTLLGQEAIHAAIVITRTLLYED